MRDEVTEIKEFISRLRHRKTVLLAEMKAIDSGIEAMEVLAAATHPLTPERASTPPRKLYADMSPQDAVQQFLRSRGDQLSTVKEIQEALTDGGLSTRSTNVYSIIYTALVRLKEKPGSGVYQSGGKWGFREP